MEKKELIQELIYSLPSKRLIEVVNVGAVKVRDEYIILKNRPGYEFKLEEAVVFDDNYGWNYDYSEILGKTVIFSEKMIGLRGLKAIEKYFKSNPELQSKELWVAFVKSVDKGLNKHWSESNSAHHHIKPGFKSKEAAEKYIQEIESKYEEINKTRLESDKYKVISGLIPYKLSDHELISDFFKTY